MKLQRFDNIREFWQEAEAYLLQHEAENNLLMGVSHTLLTNPTQYPDPPYLAIVRANGEVIAVAIRTPPRKLLLSKSLSLDAITLIAQDLQHQAQLPGVMGLVPEVEAFLQVWQQLTGQYYRRAVEMIIHQLQTIQPLAPVNGYLRLATKNDRHLLLRWLPAFDAEIGMGVAKDVERMVDNLLKTQNTYLWEDQNPVSLAGGKKFSLTAARIGPVYTPPEYRRQGYATACVAALSQTFLNTGCNDCFLLTDLANLTSNHIYREIGYVPVCDWDEYSFIAEG